MLICIYSELHHTLMILEERDPSLLVAQQKSTFFSNFEVNSFTSTFATYLPVVNPYE